MRYAIISDIHANLEAFSSVLDDIKVQGGADRILCLGDVVGYGPDPHECIELLRSSVNVCVVGNHDLASIGEVSTEEFNSDAAAACIWTSARLNAGDISFIRSLPLKAKEEDFTLAHGSPRDPVWEYLLDTGSARNSFGRFRTRMCLVGHTHVPLLFVSNGGGAVSGRLLTPGKMSVPRNERMIINPGGVGQPRDGDPRASYAIYDSSNGAMELRRVAYDIEVVQKKIKEGGLPASLAARLSYGT